MARTRRTSLRRFAVLDLAAELQRRQSELPQLKVRRDELAAELEQVDAAIAALSGGGSGGRSAGRAARGTGAASGRGGGGRKRPKNDSNLPDALAKVLNGKTMSVIEAADAVQKAGYKTNSANFRTMVNIALLNKKRFKRVERGQYTAA